MSRSFLPPGFFFLSLVLSAAPPGQASGPTIFSGGRAPGATAGGPAIDFVLTGTTDLTTNACGEETTFAVPPGTEIRLCYTAFNIGDTSFSNHDLADSDGPVFENLAFDLDPGMAAYLMQNRGPLVAGDFTATWTAYNAGPTDVVSDTDSVSVLMLPPVVGCNVGVSTFSHGLPAGWTSYDARALAELPDSPVDWSDLVGCGEGLNYSGGRGNSACVSSDLAGDGPYDAQLRSHSFSLEGVAEARLEFRLNYQDFDDTPSFDTLEVIVSTDGGATWELLGSSEGNDYGGFRSVEAISVTLALTPYVGEPDVRVAFRYVDSAEGASDWYVQVDDVAVTCDGGLFFDGFESGDHDAWSAIEPIV